MSYLNKVLYHGLNLQATMNAFENAENPNEHTAQMEKSYDAMVHFIGREQEVYGDAAAEAIFENMTEEMLDAYEYAAHVLSADPVEDEDIQY